jgi:glycerol-3-phosphate acyltransferase PlsY
MLELGTKFLISYLIGSLMGGLIMGRLRGGVDIRTMGSGNAGGTNALRTQGALFALGVIIIDIGKGAVAAGVVPGLDLPFAPTDPQISREWLAVACAAAAVAGHVWPIYHRFRGGKGAATMVGTLTVLAPGLLLPLLGVWLLVLTITGYVGLSTMTAAVALPAFVAAARWPADQPLLVYGIVMAAFIIWCHRSNVQRMLDGVENRNPKVMLFRRFAKQGGTAGDGDDGH